MPGPVDYRTAVIARIRDQIQGLREVDWHGGVFTEDEAKRRISNSPSVYVACLGMKPENFMGNGQLCMRLQIAAYVFTQSRGTVSADTLGWSIASQIAHAVLGETLTADTLMPENFQLESLWTGDLDKHGACIIAAIWDVEMAVGKDRIAIDLGFIQPEVDYSGNATHDANPQIRGEGE